MLKNYIKIAWRNFLRNRTSSFINVGGLAVGMAVAMLIGLWIWDELSYNKSFENHNRIAQVLTNSVYNGGSIGTDFNTAPPYGPELRRLYGSEFKQVLMTTRPWTLILSSGEKKLMKTGYYFEPGVTEMLSLKMLKGSRAGLQNPASIMLSESVAKAFYGNSDPLGKTMKIDNKEVVTITGIYKDLPHNTDFNDMGFISTWQLYISSDEHVRKDNWEQDGFQTFVQLADHADMQKVSAAIKDLKLRHLNEEQAKGKPRVFLLPMNDFRLHSDFDNGIPSASSVRFVWLYGIIGVFVLLLACINFMNLATARSERRAKEVGIRKAIGSMRQQLINQFLSESLLVVVFAFFFSLVLVNLLLPFFNEVSDKQVSMMWANPWFWGISIVFILLTGLVAGSYPAFYLSSFQAVKVLKGSFRAGRWASLPRKALVVLQFTVSIVLAIGVIVVFRQIQIGKDRPVGYQRAGLISVNTPTDDIHNHLDAVRAELKRTGAVVEIAESVNKVTNLGFSTNGLEWINRPRDPNFWIGKAYISPEYGKTVGWQIVEGRDFSRAFATDSTAMVLNETMVKYMGLQHPVGMTIKETLFGKTTAYTVIGVVRDLLQQSPYRSVKETIYIPDLGKNNNVNIRISPNMSAHQAIAIIGSVFRKYDPESPFEYRFTDDDYARKFGEEERISKLAGFFAILAIFISCLGLFGMASFTAEQRTKEIGVRKVLGASVFNLWGLLSKDFVMLVMLSLVIAAPLAYYFMHGWLQSYQYRTSLSWWIFAAAGMGAMVVTVCTVSWQAIRAAVANPTKSLRAE